VGAGPLRIGAGAGHPPRPPIPIAGIDERARSAVLAADPAGSLGRLGELAAWLAGVTGTERPAVRARVVVAVGDGARPGAVATLAREAGVELVVADPGVVAAAPEQGSAMAPGDVALAVDAGRELAAQAARDGMTVVAGGQIAADGGTRATCLAAALTGAAPPDSDPVTARALALHGPELGSPPSPLRALRRLGSGEIALLCGLALGAGEHGLGYVCDGSGSTAAAAVAAGIEPDLRLRLLAGHRSPCPGHAALLEHLALEPVLELGIRGDDGSGAVAALAVLRLACAALRGVA
jgi:nicotinate-nucleotide--dimethylbenzimidazole phosphoribosyltransferase